MGIGLEPKWDRQRALLVRTPHGKVLWDCVSPIDARELLPQADREWSQRLSRASNCSRMTSSRPSRGSKAGLLR